MYASLARADEIPERLVRRIGNPHRREVTSAVAVGKLGGVTPVGYSRPPRASSVR